MRVDDKAVLFHFLTNLQLADVVTKTVIMTYDSTVVQFSESVDTSEISPCGQEEADTRLLLHCLHSARCGMKRSIFKTVDADVVVLAVAFFDRLSAKVS